MRDEQVRRYARHILIDDVGGLGQTALLVANARLAVDGEPSAALVAATYLAAGGVGAVIVGGATDDQLAALIARGPDSRIHRPGERKIADGSNPTNAIEREVPIPEAPAWWPTASGDATALAYWRGGIAATRWMAEIANR